MSAKPPDKKGRTILSEMIASQARKQIPALGDMLAGSPFQPPIIKNNWFKGKTFYIDGYTFESCRFDGCILITSEATFVFRQCYISSDCVIRFNGPSLKVAKLLMHQLRTTGRLQIIEGAEGIYATLHLDGTFTLE